MEHKLLGTLSPLKNLKMPLLPPTAIQVLQDKANFSSQYMPFSQLSPNMFEQKPWETHLWKAETEMTWFFFCMRPWSFQTSIDHHAKSWLHG